MKNFIFLLIFSLLSAGIMLSGISMKNSTQSGAITLVLAMFVVAYFRGKAKRSRFKI